MSRVYVTHLLVQLAGIMLPAVAALGQVPGSASRRPERLTPLVLVGSTLDDRLRLDQILGRAGTGGMLIRSPSVLTPPLAGEGPGLRWAVMPPVLEAVWNSDLPFSLNDGALWAGRGLSTRITAGARAQFRHVSLILAPELIDVRNADFLVLPATEPGRSPFASPWRTATQSADMPLRFGNQPFTMIAPGQTTLAVRVRGIVVGASTEDQWWGPGIRNALVMSNNAAGLPHLFIRTGAPVQTPLGHVEAKWLVGGLTESLYFDSDGSNDLRSLSALAATLQPAAVPDLELGVARAVYGLAGGVGAILPSGFFDVLGHWGRVDEPEPGDRPREQLLSLFARWVFPASGAEVYGEWARVILPKSLRELLVAPQRTQGYTVGLQWARAMRADAGFRAQVEATMLEQTPRERGAPVPSFYVSSVVPHGYTHRGQVIGAAIGPGSSSQWVAVDYLAPRWRVGLVGGRIRWEDEAYYRQPTGLSFHSHDVSVFGGIRVGGTLRGSEIGAELLMGKRFNYLFQNPTGGDIADPTFDVRNLTLKLSVGPAGGSRHSALGSPGT